jgi:hypothetical protein
MLAVIQTVPSRAEVLPRLLNGLEPMEKIVITDQGEPNPWRGYQACLHSLIHFPDKRMSHGVILQDDAIVCKNFPLAVERIIEAKPENVICLFVAGTQVGKLILKPKERFCRLPTRSNIYVPVVALIWPREKAADVLEWVASKPRNVKPNPRSDDAMIGLWARQRKETVYATYPSLVQHPDDVPSAKGKNARGAAQRGNDRGRIALNYIGGGDPLALDWS